MAAWRISAEISKPYTLLAPVLAEATKMTKMSFYYKYLASKYDAGPGTIKINHLDGLGKRLDTRCPIVVCHVRFRTCWLHPSPALKVGHAPIPVVPPNQLAASPATVRRTLSLPSTRIHDRSVFAHPAIAAEVAGRKCRRRAGFC